MTNPSSGARRTASYRGRCARGCDGVALMTALMVGALLAVFAAAFLALMVNDYAADRVRQRAVQAEWDARAGIERYEASGQLPPRSRRTHRREIQVVPGSSRDVCVVHLDSRTGDLRFEGISRGVCRSILLLGGNPEREVELP